MQNLVVANTILQQLGGNRMAAMIGAHSFVGSADSLTFKFKSNGRDGIKCVRVTLDPSDTYTVEFFKGRTFAVVDTVSGVYCDMLQDIVAERAGLALSL